MSVFQKRLCALRAIFNLAGRAAGKPVMNVWPRAHDALADVYDTTTFQNLPDKTASTQTYVPSYCIQHT